MPKSVVTQRLQLPDIKDNLDTRLILRRRRLDEKAWPMRMVRPERGRMRLESGTTMLN